MTLEAPITFGAGVSLRLAADLGAYVASPGFADPRLVVRRRDRPSFPLRQFDRCVFRFQFPPRSSHEGHRVKKLLSSDQSTTSQGHLTYGRTVCIVHAYSGLYVTVVRRPADGNAAHFGVVLMSQEDAGSACRFRVMPRYKIRSEGDRVYNKDMIYLQQESSMLSIHAVSSISLGPEEAECTASENGVSLEINVYDEAEQPDKERHPVLRAGCASLIFHREKDALLTVLRGEQLSKIPKRGSGVVTPVSRGIPTSVKVAECGIGGSGSSSAASPTVCFSHYDKPVTNLSPEQLQYGCNALWFFENVDSTVGGTIEPHTQFRLRHGSTGYYLSKGLHDTTFQFVELVTVEELESTIFELELVSSGGTSSAKVYSSKSFVRIRHRNSGSYLSSVRQANSDISHLSVAEHPNLEDSVTVLMVPRKRQQELCYLIGNVEFLSSYIRMFYTMQDPHCQLRPSDPLVTRVVHRAAASLSALICFCTESDDDDPLTREGLPIATHQQSMFEVQLHCIVMDVLLCPFVSAAKENKLELPLEGGVLSIKNLLDEKLQHVHRVCRLCYRLLKQMSKGSPYAGQLVEYVAFMQAQEGYKLHVADTQLEIFTNNPNIPPDRCEANVRHFMNLLLTKERSAGYLRFLSSLCVVNGQGVSHNQVLVSTLLLKDHREKILYPTKLEDGVLKVFIASAPKKKKNNNADLLMSTQVETAAAPSWVVLSEFLKSGDSKMIKFYESSIELLGNLCIGSDSTCLALVRDFISQEHISAAIDPQFQCSEGLRSSYFTLALHVFVRDALSRRQSVPFTENTCGELVRPPQGDSKAIVSTGEPSFRKGSFVSEGHPQETEDFLDNVKRKALLYIQQSREEEVSVAGHALVLVLSHIWHDIVIYEAFSHDELCGAAKAVINCLGSTNVAKNPERYKRSEDTESVMRMKQGLCALLRTILEHETTRIADSVMVELARGVDGASAVNLATTLIQELQTNFLQDELLAILMDLVYYENKQLVAGAVELTLLLCNVPGTIAKRIMAAELVEPLAIRSFDMFFKIQRQLRRNLSATDTIVSEDALQKAVRELTSFDPLEDPLQSPFSQSPQTLRSANRNIDHDDDEDGGDEEGKDHLNRNNLRTAASAARLHRSMTRVFKRGAQAALAAASMSVAAGEKRKTWRRTASKLEEYSRLLYCSQLHVTLLKVLATPIGAELQEALMEFFRILTIADDSARALGEHITAFIPFLSQSSTQEDAAAIVLRIVEVNPWMADRLQEETVVALTRLLVKTKEPNIAECLEHVTLGEYPVPSNQNLVLNALIDAKVMDTFISDALQEKTAVQMAFRSACVDLVACCCVNNASCRAYVQQTIRADDIMHVLEQSNLTNAHLVPYYKLLTSGFLSTEDDLTAQEQLQRKRLWADNVRWWRLVDGRIFSFLTIDEDTQIDGEITFLGVVPMLISFFANLYSPVQCSKSKVALPLIRVAKKICQFTETVLKMSDTTDKVQYRFETLAQLLSTLTQHIDHKHELYATFSNLKMSVQQTLQLQDKQTEKKANGKSLQGSDAFSLWTLNNEAALGPLLNLWSADKDRALYKCSAPAQSRMRHLHELLIQHISDRAFSYEGATGIMATLRYSITQYQEDSLPFTEAQNYVNSIGCLKMITETAFSSSEETSAEAFALGIAVLEGGNRNVQDQLLNFFTSTDERFFQETSLYITQATNRAYQKRAREGYLSFYSASRNRALAFGNVKASLRLLQLMCEGHHSGLQDYLREQQDNLRSVNVVKDIVQLFSELTMHDLSEASVPLLLQTLNVLTEVCQGPCSGNQKLIVSNGGCQSINAVLTSPSFAIVSESLDNPESERLLQIKRSAVTLLLALMEGNTDDTIAGVILLEIPVQGLSTLAEQLIKTPAFMEQSSEDACELVYSLLIAAHTLVNTTADYDKPEVQLMIEEAKKLLDRYSSNCGMLGTIEIERHERIERVYFRVPTICSLLTEETKEKLLWSLDRSTQGSKLSDFLDKIDEIIFDLEATHRVTQRMADNKVFMILGKWPLQQWDDFSLVVAVVMNLLFVAVVDDARGLLDKSVDWFGVEGVIRLCAYMQLLICTVIAFLDGSLNFPLILYKQSKAIQQPTTIQKVEAIIRRRETLFRSANVVFALIGFFFSDFFFAFHLLGLITKSSILKNVIVAVTQNGRSLLLTGILGCILVYLFSIIGFVMFQDHFESDACGTLTSCVAHILTSGLRQGGGIGDKMKEVKHGELNYVQRTIYDFLFWAIMIVIFLNILFGIIIDTFAELRDDKSKKEEDMRTKCLICGIDSYTFDRYGTTGFVDHVKKEHNMWQYLYFLHHLRRKEPTEYTGQESYVADCVKRGDISFFPAKCLSLKNIPKGSTEDSHAGETAEGEGSNVDAGASRVRQGATERRFDASEHGRGGPLLASASDGLAAATLVTGDAALQASLLASSEQTVSSLSRIIQRLDAMEKGSGRISRMESNLRDRDATPTSSSATRQQLLEADHTHQLNLAHVRQEYELRHQRSVEAMHEMFERFSMHFHCVHSLWCAYERSKVQIFVGAVATQTILMHSKISELTKHGDLVSNELALVRQQQAKEREGQRLRQMMIGMEYGPASSSGSTDATNAVQSSSSSLSPPKNYFAAQLQAGALSTANDMTSLMQQGHEYMMLLRQMTAESRAAHSAAH